MKFKKVLSLLLAAIIIAALAGCSAGNAGQSEAVEPGDVGTDVSEPAGSDTVMEDRYEAVTIENFDRTVEFTEKPQRIVVLTLNSAEIVAALGEADNIVAISRNNNTVDDVLPEYYDNLKDCDFPDEINSGVPTLEGLLSLEPDLVVCNSYYFNVPQIFGTMEDYQANGVEFYITEGSYVSNCTVENTYNDIRNLGAIFGKQDEAEALIADMRARLDAVAALVEDREPVKVMSLDTIDEDLFSVAGGVGLAQNLIELSGGTNVFADTDSQFLSANIEEIISRSPEVIVIHAYTREGEQEAQEKLDYLLSAEELSEVPAVKNNNIIVVPLFQINPSLQNVNYVETLAAAMYPELFE